MSPYKAMRKAKRIFLFCALVLLAGALIYGFLGPFSKISHIELKADETLRSSPSYAIKEKEILSFLNHYKGRFLWQASLKKMVRQIHVLYPGVEAYAVRRFPSRLAVFLKNKNTAFLLLKEGEGFYSVSYEGEIGTKKTGGESLDFPLLRGESFWSQPLLRKRALLIVSSFPKEGSALSVSNISEIVYNRVNDSFLFFLVKSHFVVELKKQPSSRKIRNIDFVLNYLKRKERKKGLIDARWDKKIIVKNRN